MELTLPYGEEGTYERLFNLCSYRGLVLARWVA